jgi:hypothetical protein
MLEMQRSTLDETSKKTEASNNPAGFHPQHNQPEPTNQ